MADNNGLYNKKPSQTYRDLLHTSLSSVGLSDSADFVYDGAGNQLPIQLSKTAIVLKCNSANLNIVSITASTFEGCSFNAPQITYNARDTLVDSSLGASDIYFGDSNSCSENCQHISVSGTVSYTDNEVSNMDLSSFSTTLNSFAVISAIPRGQAFFLTVRIDKQGHSINKNAFGSSVKMLFPNGTNLTDNNFGAHNGVCILKMLFVAITADQNSNVPFSVGNYALGIIDGNCMLNS